MGGMADMDGPFALGNVSIRVAHFQAALAEKI
jgi:hypothetical protein